MPSISIYGNQLNIIPGLESRFAYLFDSPARSHVTTALASQATAEDDVELRAQWEATLDTRSVTLRVTRSVTMDSLTQFNVFDSF